MDVTAKMIWLAASILLVLQLADCSPLLTKKNDENSDLNKNTIAGINVNGKSIYKNVKNGASTAVQMGKSAGSTVVQTGKSAGSTVVQTGKTAGSNASSVAYLTLLAGSCLPGFIIHTAKDLCKRVKQESKSITDSENKPGVLKRTVSTHKAVYSVGAGILSDGSNYIKNKFGTHFEHNDNTTPDDTAKKPISIRRVMSKPIVSVMTVKDVTIDGLKDATNAVINY